MIWYGVICDMWNGGICEMWNGGIWCQAVFASVHSLSLAASFNDIAPCHQLFFVFSSQSALKGCHPFKVIRPSIFSVLLSLNRSTVGLLGKGAKKKTRKKSGLLPKKPQTPPPTFPYGQWPHAFCSLFLQNSFTSAAGGGVWRKWNMFFSQTNIADHMNTSK